MNAEQKSGVPQRPGESRDANREVESHGAELEQFIYTVSHDLKSPLVTVQGFAGLMERDLREGRTDRLAEFTEQIKGGVAQMAELIDDLLNLSRVGRVVKPSEPVDFGDLIRKILRLHQHEIDTRQIDVDLEEDLPTVSVDKERIAQAIDNLIINAIKYGSVPPAPRLEIGSVVNDDEVCIYIRDNGPGIPARYHEKIFDLFERLDSNTEGTGVGLAIVKRAVEVHGGRAWVESVPGQGATFWLAFPSSLLVKSPSPATEGQG